VLKEIEGLAALDNRAPRGGQMLRFLTSSCPVLTTCCSLLISAGEDSRWGGTVFPTARTTSRCV
jgi:hypothetical protein